MKQVNVNSLVLGISLIVLQFILYLYGFETGELTFSFKSLYDVVCFIPSFFFGIIGIIVIIRAVRAPCSPTASKDSNTVSYFSMLRQFLRSRMIELIFFTVLTAFFAFVSHSIGYTNGQAEGTDAGWDTGYNAGYDEGTKKGYETGHQDGYSEGQNKGYDEGYTNGRDLYASEVWFFRNYACVITTAGEKYHHWNCYHIKDQPFYIYNLDWAESEGYRPCLDCWEAGLETEADGLTPVALPSRQLSPDLAARLAQMKADGERQEKLKAAGEQAEKSGSNDKDG